MKKIKVDIIPCIIWIKGKKVIDISSPIIIYRRELLFNSIREIAIYHYEQLL